MGPNAGTVHKAQSDQAHESSPRFLASSPCPGGWATPLSPFQTSRGLRESSASIERSDDRLSALDEREKDDEDERGSDGAEVLGMGMVGLKCSSTSYTCVSDPFFGVVLLRRDDGDNADRWPLPSLAHLRPPSPQPPLLLVPLLRPSTSILDELPRPIGLHPSGLESDLIWHAS